MKSHDVIKRPLLTEKSTGLKELNQYCFEVSPRATKIDVKIAVETLFKVKVDDVRTMQYAGKKKRVGRTVGRKNSWKKAVVTLKEGSRIELFEGV